MQYILEMAGVTILADVPFCLHENDITKAFLRSAADCDRADLRLEIVPVEHLPEIADERYTEDRRTYVGDGTRAGIFFRSYADCTPYAFVSRSTLKKGYLRCEYLPGNEEFINYTRNLLMLMDIEATLLDFDALILHASLVRWNGIGFIFSAPSGTGKSTQASLWERYEDADVLNGDRAALRQINGVWTAFGLPFAGTSGIYRNESAPLKAVVVLRQAKDNCIRRIRGAEAFRYLYPETMIHRWDPDFERRTTALLLQIMEDVPVFLLNCRPDREAVELLRDTLESYQKDISL